MTSAGAGRIVPVILSGGSGSRLWPLSRAGYPKQFLPLAGERTMIQETALRVADQRFAAPVVVCNEEHRFIVAEQFRMAEREPSTIILEPAPRNTAPAACIAALRLLDEGEDALMLVAPSDHVILDREAFLQAVDRGARAAAQGQMVTFGVKPTGPETGYGYIRDRGAIRGLEGVHAVDAFIEKPDLAAARTYATDPAYHWNSGIFLFSAESYVGELERANPAMVAACRKALEASQGDLNFCRLDREAFSASPADSIDYAVMEKTDRGAVVPVEMGWNDVGAWSALWEIAPKDEQGNVTEGDVLLHETANAYVRTDGPLIAVAGLDDVVVVATDDAVLVASRGKVQEVRTLVQRLKAEGRTEHLEHTTVHRPWGCYRGIDRGERFQVKRIVVQPGERLSVQMHHHRAEHWVVVSGTAKVTRGEDTFLLGENESTYIPATEVHCLENPGKVPLHLIEVQSGGYLGEDDIVRFEDRYGRKAADE